MYNRDVGAAFIAMQEGAAETS